MNKKVQNPDVATHACPDPANPAVFEITRTFEDGRGATGGQ